MLLLNVSLMLDLLRLLDGFRMKTLDVFDQVGLTLGFEFTMGALDQLGQVNLPDVISKVAHGAGRILANRAAKKPKRC